MDKGYSKRRMVESVSVFLIMVVLRQLKSCEGTKVDDAYKYLDRYGYIGMARDMSDGRTGNIRGIALKRFQKYAKIPVTGRMDSKTMEMLTSPRCGGKDFETKVKVAVNGVGVHMSYRDMRRKKRYLKQGSEWKKQILTYSIHGDSRPRWRLSTRDVETTLYKAFRQWQGVTSLTFRKLTRNNRAADIKIMFRKGSHGDPYSFDGKGGTVAHAFYPVSIRGLEGDVHFDNDEVWTINGGTGTTDFTWTSLHEIGHSIGLEHSENPNAIMWPWFRGYKPEFKLHKDDIDGIQSIYGPPKSLKPNPVTSVAQKSRICTQHDFDAVLYDSRSGNTYLFKGDEVWTMNYNRFVRQRSVKISSKWPGFPKYKRVDAAYVNKKGSTIFFSGNRYWEFKGRTSVRQNRPLNEYINEAEKRGLYKIDAAMVWERNGRTYFFNNGNYWRFNEINRKIDRGYPRKTSMVNAWRKVNFPVQAATGWRKKRTFFFHKDKVYNYSSKLGLVTKKYPKNRITYFIKNCRR